ncbi:MAG: succinate dehydrogenase, hydrophobic membrane anchor protein [Alphaproteobacteria bacterium]|nr:succinate dehydrogenase, hydrophobic membrane anchor protein [Alphaproteobacteria bacterium]
MITPTRKWLFLKISSIVFIPLMLWFIINFISIYDQSYVEVLDFLSKKISKILFSFFIISGFTFSVLSISEVFEDYISNDKLKNVANRILNFSAMVVTLLTMILIF